MLQLDAIKKFYPAQMRDNALFWKFMLKEYILIMTLEYLSGTPYIKKLSFIGGTCIRLTKGIDRFSEDLDFEHLLFNKDNSKRILMVQSFFESL